VIDLHYIYTSVHAIAYVYKYFLNMNDSILVCDNNVMLLS